jgi:hypothetical protein
MQHLKPVLVSLDSKKEMKNEYPSPSIAKKTVTLFHLEAAYEESLATLTRSHRS